MDLRPSKLFFKIIKEIYSGLFPIIREIIHQLLLDNSPVSLLKDLNINKEDWKMQKETLGEFFATTLLFGSFLAMVLGG